MKNLLRRGLLQLQETQSQGYEEPFVYKTGTILIDPNTHRVLQPGSGAPNFSRGTLYAVGAMTRGQIIDASMAHGLARSTATIADELVNRLT